MYYKTWDEANALFEKYARDDSNLGEALQYAGLALMNQFCSEHEGGVRPDKGHWISQRDECLAISKKYLAKHREEKANGT